MRSVSWMVQSIPRMSTEGAEWKWLMKCSCEKVRRLGKCLLECDSGEKYSCTTPEGGKGFIVVVVVIL